MRVLDRLTDIGHTPNTATRAPEGERTAVKRMSASEIAALLGVSERTARRYIVEWSESSLLPVRVIPPPFGRGRTRYVVDADAETVLLALNGLPMAA